MKCPMCGRISDDMIPSRSKRSIRGCDICVHYARGCILGCKTCEIRHREFSKQFNTMEAFRYIRIQNETSVAINIEFPCIHHFTHDELKEIGESMP